jgi:hypothetical protein
MLQKLENAPLLFQSLFGCNATDLDHNNFVGIIPRKLNFSIELILKIVQVQGLQLLPA